MGTVFTLVCGEFGTSTALRFLQTSQNEFPVVIGAVHRDIRSRAILHRYKFLGFGGPQNSFRDLRPERGSSDPYVS